MTDNCKRFVTSASKK